MKYQLNLSGWGFSKSFITIHDMFYYAVASSPFYHETCHVFLEWSWGFSQYIMFHHAMALRSLYGETSHVF